MQVASPSATRAHQPASHSTHSSVDRALIGWQRQQALQTTSKSLANDALTNPPPNESPAQRVFYSSLTAVLHTWITCMLSLHTSSPAYTHTHTRTSCHACIHRLHLTGDLNTCPSTYSKTLHCAIMQCYCLLQKSNSGIYIAGICESHKFLPAAGLLMSQVPRDCSMQHHVFTPITVKLESESVSKGQHGSGMHA
jgi:hypothetical protein